MANVGLEVSQSVTKKTRPNLAALWLLLPLLVVIIGFFVIPMAKILYISFVSNYSPSGPAGAFSLEGYQRFFAENSHALWVTVKVSLYTCGVALVLGYPIAVTMAKASPKMRNVLTLLVVSPLLISIIVRNFGWYLLLLEKGTINTVLINLGIIQEPLSLLHSEIGVVIGLSNAYLPYLVLAIATSLYNIDPSLEKAASILGASPFRTFLSVTLPLSLPGIVSGLVLVFSMSMSAYVTPALMGGPNVPMLPVIAYDQIIHLLRWTYGSAISYVLLGVTILSVTLFTTLFEKSRYKEVFR